MITDLFLILIVSLIVTFHINDLIVDVKQAASRVSYEASLILPSIQIFLIYIKAIEKAFHRRQISFHVCRGRVLACF